MPWKKDENGNFVVDAETGNPIWAGQDGTEAPYDPADRLKQVAELTRKNRQRGEELEAARATLAHLEGIEDVPAFVAQAKQNAESFASLKDKDRETEEAIARRIQEAVKAAVAPRDADLAKAKAEIEKVSGHLHQHVIGNAFLTSKFVAEKCEHPALAVELYSKHFRVSQDGNLQAFDPDTGDTMYGEDGNEAKFDEAFSRILGKSPYRNAVEKSVPGGSGAQPANGSRMGTPTRFTDCKTPEQQAAFLNDPKNLVRPQTS